MRKLFVILFLLFAVPSYASPPSRSFTYVTGTVISSSDVTANEDSIFNYLQAGVDTYSDGTIVNADIHSSANIQSDKLNLTAIAQSVANSGSTTLTGTFAANGTTNSIGNGGSDVLTLNVPGGMTLSAATTWTLSGALTFSGTIADLGTVTTANIDGGTMDGVQIGGTTATGELIVNDASDDADGLGSQGTSGQVLESQGIGVLPQFASVIDNYDDGTIQEGNTLSTERSTSSATYAVLKQTTPLPRKGTISVNWEMKNNDGVSTVYSKIYVNSVAVGVEKTTTDNTYIGTFTDTAISVAAGDIVQIYGRTSGGATVYIKNVKILCANPTTIIEASGL